MRKIIQNTSSGLVALFGLTLSVLSMDVHVFLAHRIRISENIWDRKSYLTHAILPRLSREGYIHWLYWNSRTL